MIKFLKKYQKQVLAVFSVGLMIAFSLPAALTGGGGGGDQKRGTMGTQSVTDNEIVGAKREFELLSGSIQLPAGRTPDGSMAYEPAIYQLEFAFDDLPQLLQEGLFYCRKYGASNPQQLYQFFPPILVNSYMGLEGSTRQLMNQIDGSKHDAMFALLIREAKQMGVDVSSEQFSGAVNNMRTQGVDPQVAQHAIYDMLLVHNAFARMAGVVKVPQNDVTRLVGYQMQKISVDVVEFSAKNYLDKTPRPSIREIEDQFQTFRGVEPGITERNPMGFGYREPDRVAFQYIEISKDELARAVESKVKALGAMRSYYLEHQDLFTTDAGPMGALGPSTQAMVRPYEAVRDEVYKKLQKEDMQELVKTILPDISRVMDRDYRAWHSQAAPNGEHLTDLSPDGIDKSPATPLGKPYPSYDYLQSLALSMQETYKVLPVVGQVATPQTMQQLNDAGLPPMKSHATTQSTTGPATRPSNAATQPLAEAAAPSATEPAEASRSPVPMGLASASVQESMDVMFPEYAAGYVAALVDEKTQTQTPVGLLELDQPSSVLIDNQGNYWIFRLTRIAKSRPADKAEVEERVEADCRRVASINMAHAAASELLDGAIRRGLRAEAATTRPAYTVTTTGFFGFNDSSAKDLAPFELPSIRDRQVFTQKAMQLLVTPRASDPSHPVRLIDLPQDDRELVIELRDIQPNWTIQNYGVCRAGYQANSLFDQRLNVAANWFDYDRLIARVNYKEIKGD